MSMIFPLAARPAHETTVNLIGKRHARAAAASRPTRKLHAQPELIEPRWEELLRFTNPVIMARPRFAREDLDFTERPLPPERMVIRSFARPTATKIFSRTRYLGHHPTARTRHGGCGFGAHFCLERRSQAREQDR